MRRRTEILLAALTVVTSIGVTLLVAEVVLRFLPVASALQAVPVNAEQPILHYTPDRSFVHSFGWTLHHAVRGRVNNVGWVNDQDYKRNDPQPLVAVIGDSLIEARTLPFAEAMQGRLAHALAGRSRVYSFAVSDAALSQYVMMARHAVHDYGARAVVINVVGNVIGNDFDESHTDYSARAGFWIYAPDADGQLRLTLFDYRPSPVQSVLRRSALARYLLLNVGLIHYRRERLISMWSSAGESVPANPAPIEKRMRDSRAVIAAFFRDLRDQVGLPPDRVLFTLEGFRYPEAAKAREGSYHDQVRQAFREFAGSRGYEVVDLDPLFFARYQRSRERFERAYDHHWTGVGHEIAAEAVMSSRLFRRMQQPGALSGL